MGVGGDEGGTCYVGRPAEAEPTVAEGSKGEGVAGRTFESRSTGSRTAMSHEDATSTFVNPPRMWFWPPEIIEGVLCELSIDPSCLTKAHTQQEHGVIMQRVADQRHYLVLSQLDEAGSFGTLPSDYANIAPRDFAELSSAIQSEWPRTATDGLVRLSSLATYIEDRDVATPERQIYRRMKSRGSDASRNG